MPSNSAGGLSIVATPIGNLADLSERARHCLEAADLILCEDTRRTHQLLGGLGISGRLDRFDAHSSPAKRKKLVEQMVAGEKLALVSDAGTPAVSDPGAELVREAREAEVRVTAIPGPSAVTALLSIAAQTENNFAFKGFFPRKTVDQKRAIDFAVRVGADSKEAVRIFVYFESPKRILSALKILAESEGISEVIVGKELTKLHERVFAGDPVSVLNDVEAHVKDVGTVGEYVFLFLTAAPRKDAAELDPEAQGWDKALKCLLNAKQSPSDSAKMVSQLFGVPKKVAYSEAVRLGNNTNKT